MLRTVSSGLIPNACRDFHVVSRRFDPSNALGAMSLADPSYKGVHYLDQTVSLSLSSAARPPFLVISL